MKIASALAVFGCLVLPLAAFARLGQSTGDAPAGSEAVIGRLDGGFHGSSLKTAGVLTALFEVGHVRHQFLDLALQPLVPAVVRRPICDEGFHGLDKLLDHRLVTSTPWRATWR